MPAASRPRVVIIGGGFGGLNAAKALRDAPVDVLLVDRRNHHVFQPLLYQVATAGLSPGDIASPIRWILRRHRNLQVWLGEATRIDVAGKIVHLADAEIAEVLDSLVVDLEYLGRPSCLLLFVQLRDGVALGADLEQRLRASIKKALSARHVPDEIHQVTAIPRTLSGKKMELPIKKLLLGAAAEQVMKRDAMANADAVAWYQRFAEGRP